MKAERLINEERSYKGSPMPFVMKTSCNYNSDDEHSQWLLKIIGSRLDTVCIRWYADTKKLLQGRNYWMEFCCRLITRSWDWTSQLCRMSTHCRIQFHNLIFRKERLKRNWKKDNTLTTVAKSHYNIIVCSWLGQSVYKSNWHFSAQQRRLAHVCVQSKSGI